MVIALIIIFGPLVAPKLLPGLIGLLIGAALIGPNVFGVLDCTKGIGRRTRARGPRPIA